MALVFVGTDFKDTPLADLERLEDRADEIRSRLTSGESMLTGVVLLATCNRFEVYFEAESFHEALDFTLGQVAQELGIAVEAAGAKLRVLYGSALVQHLYSVTSGLESMVIGEGEIAGQVKRALQASNDLGCTSSNLQRLFQTAAAVSKQVVTETGIGASGRSLVSIGLDVVQQQRELSGGTALIVGTGAYARIVTAALKRHGVSRIGVYSRSGRAEQFALSHDLEPVAAEQVIAELSAADVVVSASGSQGFAIDLASAQLALQRREKGPLVIIDVALSRDVDPRVTELPGVEILDLERLKELAPPEHLDALISAQEIIAQAVEEFDLELKSRVADPVISALRAHVGIWVEQEVEVVRRKSGEEVARDVERSLNRVANAILHTPSVKVKDLAKSGNHEDYLKAVKLLFGIEPERDVEN